MTMTTRTTELSSLRWDVLFAGLSRHAAPVTRAAPFPLTVRRLPC
jgi:hypothetical protein